MLYFAPKVINLKIISNYETLIPMYQLFSKYICLHISYTNNRNNTNKKQQKSKKKKKNTNKPPSQKKNPKKQQQIKNKQTNKMKSKK